MGLSGHREAGEGGGVFLTAFFVFCGLSVASNLYSLIPVSGLIANDFHLSQKSAALASSVFLVAYAAGFLLLAKILDAVSRRVMLGAGLAILGLLTLAVGFSASFVELLGLRFLQGLAASIVAPTVLAFVMESYPDRRNATALAFVTAGFLMAGVVGQVAGLGMARLWGWRGIFTAMGLVHLATIALVGIIPGGARSPTSRGGEKSSLPSLLREGELRKYYLVAFTLMSSFVGMYVAMGSRYAGEGGAVADRLFMLRAIGLLGMLPSPLAGYFGKLIGQRALLAASLALATAGMVLETLLPSSSLPAMAGCTVLFVLGIAIAMPTLIGLIGGKAGAARGPAVSLFMFTLFFGASLAPVLASGVDFHLVDPTLAALLGLGLVIVLSMGRGEQGREPRLSQNRDRSHRG